MTARPGTGSRCGRACARLRVEARVQQCARRHPQAACGARRRRQSCARVRMPPIVREALAGLRERGPHGVAALTRARVRPNERGASAAGNSGFLGRSGAQSPVDEDGGRSIRDVAVCGEAQSPALNRFGQLGIDAPTCFAMIVKPAFPPCVRASRSRAETLQREDHAALVLSVPAMQSATQSSPAMYSGWRRCRRSCWAERLRLSARSAASARSAFQSSRPARRMTSRRSPAGYAY